MKHLTLIESTLTRLDEVFSAYEIFLFDLDESRTFYMSPNLQKILGISSRDLTQQRIRPLSELCHPDDWPALLRNLAGMRGDSDSPAAGICYRLRETKTGDYVHFISFQKNAGSLFDHRETLIGISTGYSDYMWSEWRHNCHFRDRMRMILESIHMSIRTRYDCERYRSSL